MNPDVAGAIDRLSGSNLLAVETAALLGRTARGELISLRGELRLALYAAVTLVVAGVGLLVKENLDRLGPVTIATALGLAAAACLAWVARTAPPFAWSERPSPNLAFDYVLLLGAMLVAAELAYIEVRFTPLGASWPLHLLLVSLLYLVLAVRYDSRIVLSLALSTFAAWRGVSLPTFQTGSWELLASLEGKLNAIGCGLLFVAAGWAARRWGRKAHFEPVAAHLGWFLVLAPLAAGATEHDSPEPEWLTWSLILLGVAGALAAEALGARRFSIFAMAVVAAYVAVSSPILEAIQDEKGGFLYLALSGVAAIAGLLAAHRRIARAG